MADVEITDNSAEILKLLSKASMESLRIVGGSVVEWIKDKAPARWGPELRDSYSRVVEEGPNGPILQVGSNMQIAPYAELGTGKHYKPSQAWLQAGAEWLSKYGPGGSDNKGKAQAGLESWIYFDELEGVFKIGTPQEASPHLGPAFTEHVEQIRAIIEDGLKNADE